MAQYFQYSQKSHLSDRNITFQPGRFQDLLSTLRITWNWSSKLDYRRANLLQLVSCVALPHHQAWNTITRHRRFCSFVYLCCMRQALQLSGSTTWMCFWTKKANHVFLWCSTQSMIDFQVFMMSRCSDAPASMNVTSGIALESQSRFSWNLFCQVFVLFCSYRKGVQLSLTKKQKQADA